MRSFGEILNDHLRSCKANRFSDNHDFRRFGRKRLSVGSVRGLVNDLLVSSGFHKFGSRRRIFDNLDKLGWVYERLDDESRELLLQILSYRILGEARVKLPVNTPEYWKKLEELDRLASRGERIETGFSGRDVNRINLASVGYPIEMFTCPAELYTQMILQQYRCESGGSVIEVERGDTVIDAGGCYGDTAIHFALKAGEGGRVYSWEFEPNNLKIFKRNLELNPDYGERVELVEHPIWSSSGKKLYVSGVGPGTRVSPTPPRDPVASIVVETYTVDDLRDDRGLKSIDFIKMDIEGAEMEALRGSTETIRRFKPKLAISVYHDIEDFWEIPQWIDSLDLGYRFRLGHATIHAEETVLFADARGS